MNPGPDSFENSNTPRQTGARLVAYATDTTIPGQVPYDMLTHINFAFLLPNADGTFRDLPATGMLEQLVSQAHQHKVKVLLSVGGWGLDKQFERLAANPAMRTTFIQGLLKLISQYHFDGADIDWEYPLTGASAQNFLMLIQELRVALPKASLLTAAVVALGEFAPGIPDETFSLVDFVNIMAYDDNRTLQHSSLEYAKSALDYWLGRGLPAQKAILGVPFYARPLEVPFAKIVAADPEAAWLDSTFYEGEQIFYNGIATINAKTRLALQRASGIMFWKLEHDAGGELSLIAAIWATMGERQ